ncbi:MAG: Trk system potassium transporter TrkA [Maricaulaceae bacterium]|jgi:trk system potassium uptake protein TrkA
MRVIICGAGRVGYGIARELANERNAVTVVDVSPRLIDQITTKLDVRGVVGHGSHPSVLEQAGAGDAEMIIAVTYSDEINMVACQVAHSVFDVPTKIARVRSQNYLDPAWRDLFSQNHMPIDVVISPELEVSRAIMRRLETPGAFDTMPFADGRVLVLGVQIDENCPVTNTPLSQLTELFPTLKAKVVGVKRDRSLFVPKPTDQLAVGDDAYLVVDAAHAERTLDIFGREEGRARRVVIIGGGNIGIFVAQTLEKTTGVRVRMIEANKEKAEAAAEAVRKTVVLNGDGLDPDLMREAGVADCEVAVALTNDDKVNVLACSLAKAEGARRSVCLINDRTFLGLKAALGIDVFVDPRVTTVSTILQHVRKGRITGLRTVEDGEAEIIEGVLLDTSPLTGKAIAKAGLGAGIVVGAVVRGDDVIIPSGDLILQVDDRLILFVERAQVTQVERAFRVAFEYF